MVLFHTQAVTVEMEAFQKSSNRNIYLNKAVVAIKRLRDEAAGSKLQSPPTSPPLLPWKTNKILSHEAVLGGKKAANISFTVKRSGGPATAKDIKGTCSHMLHLRLA